LARYTRNIDSTMPTLSTISMFRCAILPHSDCERTRWREVTGKVPSGALVLCDQGLREDLDRRCSEIAAAFGNNGVGALFARLRRGGYRLGSLRRDHSSSRRSRTPLPCHGGRARNGTPNPTGPHADFLEADNQRRRAAPTNGNRLSRPVDGRAGDRCLGSIAPSSYAEQ
jgi:hypothetical protein